MSVSVSDSKFAVSGSVTLAVYVPAAVGTVVEYAESGAVLSLYSYTGVPSYPSGSVSSSGTTASPT